MAHGAWRQSENARKRQTPSHQEAENRSGRLLQEVKAERAAKEQETLCKQLPQAGEGRSTDGFLGFRRHTNYIRLLLRVPCPETPLSLNSGIYLKL